jgi:hypothetical protein
MIILDNGMKIIFTKTSNGIARDYFINYILTHKMKKVYDNDKNLIIEF